MSICPVCNQDKDVFVLYNNDTICSDCYDKKNKEEILEKSSQSTCSAYFKGWKGSDLATAFFETFSRYVKNPNKRDIDTIYHIWLWSVHDNHTLSKTITYTFKWAKMDLMKEYYRMKQQE